jgi:hypothetical protein
MMRRLRGYALGAVILTFAAPAAICGVDDENLVSNGGFESGGAEPWGSYGAATMRVVNTDAPEGDYALEMTASEQGANPWDAALVYPNLAFEKGKLYRLTALLRSPDGMRITFKPSGVGPLWTPYGDRTFTLTEAWQRYTIVTPVIPSDVRPAELRFHIAFDTGTLLMDDVQFSALAAPSHPGSGSFDDARPRQKGIAYSSWMSGGYATSAADQSLTELESTGATWISLLVVGLQDAISSTDISARDDLTTTDEDLAHAIGAAHRLGLRVMLKPHIELVELDEHWRGQIGEQFHAESAWLDWFDAYREFISHYAELAATHGVGQFCVGTELPGTTHRADEWRQLIAAVRERFPGPLTYASNPGEELAIGWWDALDFIGVDAYYPLSVTQETTVEGLKEGWEAHLPVLSALAYRWAKPIILTEIGYRSLDGASRHPGDHAVRGLVDPQEQADCYRAAFESLYDQPWLAGMYWWDWHDNPFAGGPCDTDYTPHHKPAGNVLRSWYGAPPRAGTPPLPDHRTTPDYSTTVDIYIDGLGAGWEDWSWGQNRDLSASDHVYAGAYALSASLRPFEGLRFSRPALDTASYDWLELRVSSESDDALPVWVFFQDEHGQVQRTCELTANPDYVVAESGRWRHVLLPLVALLPAGRTVSSLTFQNFDTRPLRLWIDEVRLVAGAQPEQPAALSE